MVGWLMSLLFIGWCLLGLYKEDKGLWGSDEPRWFNMLLVVVLLIFGPFRYMMWQGLLTINVASQGVLNFIIVYGYCFFLMIILGIPYIMLVLGPTQLAHSFTNYFSFRKPVRYIFSMLTAVILNLLSTFIFFYTLPYTARVNPSSMTGDEIEVVRAAGGQSWEFYRLFGFQFYPIDYPEYTKLIGDDEHIVYINHVALFYMTEKEHVRFYKAFYSQDNDEDSCIPNLKKRAINSGLPIIK